MADSDFNIKAIITAQTSQFEKGIKQAQKSITNLSEGIAQAQNSTKNISSTFNKLGKDLLKTFAKGGAIATGIALTSKALKGLFNTVKKGVKDYEDFQQKQKVLSQTLKVTEAETWITVEALNEMANSFQDITNYSNTSINNLQTVLLGFKNIKGDNFKEATKAIMDMATVMGMDLVSATQTVGKALDDPIKGLGSLARQGFQFSESEKQMLADMVEMGNIAEAQKIILNELNTTYGGAAEAGAKATTQLKNSWSDLVREMGRNISLSVDVEPAMKEMNKVVKRWNEIIKGMADIKEISDQIIEAEKAVQAGTATDKQRIIYLEDEINKREILRKEYQEMYDAAETFESRNYAQNHLKDLGLEIGRLKVQLVTVQSRIEAEEKANEEQQKRNKKLQGEADYETKIANLKKRYDEIQMEQEKQWELREKVEKGSVDIAERINFYQDQLVAIMKEANGGITEANSYYEQQMKLISDLKAEMEEMKKKEKETSAEWEKKLIEQTIKRFETEKQLTIESEEFLKKSDWEKYQIERNYNEKIKRVALERLEFEMEEALKAVAEYANAEEEKARIMKYYQNEREEIINKYTTEYKETTKDAQEEEEKDWKEHIKKISSIFKTLAKNIKNVMKSIVSAVKNGVSLLSKAFKFNPSEALDQLLAFEDAVLTFFVETLPQLPRFVESALQSIAVLIKNLTKTVDREQLTKLIKDMLQSLSRALPSIIKDMLQVGTELIMGLIGGITQALPDVVSSLWEIKDTIVETLRFLVPQIIHLVGTLLREGIPLLVSTVFDIIDIICEDFPILAEELVNTLPVIIKAIVDNLPRLFEESLPKLINGIVNLIPTIFESTGEIIVTLVDSLPKLVDAIINGLNELLKNLSSENIAKIIEAIIKMVGDVATAMIRNIGKIVTEMLPAVIRLVWELIQKVPDIVTGVITGAWEGLKEFGSSVWEGVQSFGFSIGDWVSGLFGFANGTDSAPRGLAIVGEAGPELVNFRGGEQVLTNKNTQKALNGIGKSNVFNVTFNNTVDTTAYAMMSQLRQYQRNLAFNGVL